jgi:hypothetical protein
MKKPRGKVATRVATQKERHDQMLKEALAEIHVPPIAVSVKVPAKYDGIVQNATIFGDQVVVLHCERKGDVVGKLRSLAEIIADTSDLFGGGSIIVLRRKKL